MRIQCDVCRSGEATVFCCADEAALCGGCDRRVHGANKLAGKHERLPLSPAAAAAAAADALVCDLCQERRALFFCQQDRALLCRDCDLPVHAANPLTRNHHRFLLSSVNLHSIPNVPIAAAATPSASSEVVGSNLAPNQVGSASSASELLMPMVLPPGCCHVQDLLQHSSTNYYHEPYGFSNEQQQQQQCYDEISQFLDMVDVESNLDSSQAANTLGIWAQRSAPPPQCCFSNSNSSGEIGLVESDFNFIDVHLHAPMSSQLKATTSHSHNHRWKDDTLTLLQIRALPSTNFNRSMPF